MIPKFVETSNAARFLAGVQRVIDPGAAEACMMLVSGDAGHGKSRCGEWWAFKNDAVFLRVKASATPHWLLTDLVRELGDTAPSHTCEKLFSQAVGILAHNPRPIVIDEIEHAVRRDITVLETLRDISDAVEVPVIMLGREYVPGTLKRQKQIWSRISAHIQFAPVGRADVDKIFAEICEVEAEDAVIAEVLRQSEGLIREVVKGLRTVEEIGKRAKKAVTRADIEGVDLTHRGNGKKPKLAVV